MKSRTRRAERDNCTAMYHLLIHRSRTSHRCQCGYRTVWGEVASGECPECSETMPEGDDEMDLERASEELYGDGDDEPSYSLMVKLSLLQAAATLRAVPDA